MEHHHQDQYQHHHDHHHQQQQEEHHHHRHHHDHQQEEQHHHRHHHHKQEEQQHHHHHHHHKQEEEQQQQQQQEYIGYPIILKSFQNPTNISRQNPTNISQQNSTIHPKPQQSSRCGFLFFIIFLVGIVLLLTLPSHHRKLKFELDSLSVKPLNISNNSSNITANWNIIFSATDFESCHFGCKHHDTYYDSPIEVSIFYNDSIITYKAIDSPLSQYFAEQHRRVTHANTGVSSEHIDRSIADAIVADLVSSPRRTVNFAVTVKTIVQIERSEHHHDRDDSASWQLTASCEQVSVGFSSDDMMEGTMHGGSRTCKTSLMAT